MLLKEIADSTEKEEVVKRSFDDRVISDLLADDAKKGKQVPSKQVISQLRRKFPVLTSVEIKISKDADRVRIYFDEHGNGQKIIVPPTLKAGLGEVLVLHEIAHMLYTKDILTDKILKHRASAQAFTILRVLEDIAIEEKLEKEYPAAVEVFKSRVGHIIPLYKENTPSEFAHKVDQLFLKLRGYGKDHDVDPYVLRYAGEYLKSDDVQVKTNAIFHIVHRFTGKG